jgi:hypothetical protein
LSFCRARRTLRGMKWGVVLVFALALSACGGGAEGPSEDDRATEDDFAIVKAILRSNAAVGRAVSPFNLCLPEDLACYRRAAPKLVAVVEEEQERVSRALAETDNACLRKVGAAYDRVLEAYRGAGQAGVAGDAEAVGAALSRSSEREIAFLDEMGECGFSQGRLAEVSAGMRAVNADVIRIVEELVACERVACIEDTTRRLQATAREGRARIDDLQAELEGEEDVPACITPAFTLMRQSFTALEQTAVAVREGEAERAEREGARADELRAQAAEDLAACLGTAG